MDESKVLFLIAEGEGTTIEFKRELDLSSAKGKAEFIKDIISLANSARDISYLLIGVDKNKSIVGTANLEEERIQQIAQTYIDPPITLECRIIPVKLPAMAMIGVIAIRSTTKPHKVIRSIEHVVQNKVFVRHGSVVVEASPDEVIDMRDETRMNAEAQQHVRAAKTHIKLNKHEEAIEAYSRAIELSPTAELYLARGKIHESLQHTDMAYEDYATVVELTQSIELQKEARFGRMRLYPEVASVAPSGNSNAYYQTWNQDQKWLKAHTTGREYGQVLYLDVCTEDYFSGLTNGHPEEFIAILDEAIRHGYIEAGVYYFRAIANFDACNYGLALSDIDTAINLIIEGNKDVADYLCVRANILVRLGTLHASSKKDRFKEAFDNLERARRVSGEEFPESFGYLTHGLEMDILYKYALEYEFTHRRENKLRNVLLQSIIAQWDDFDHFSENNPEFARVIREIVGEDFLKAKRLIK